jgi:hypothetical protein
VPPPHDSIKKRMIYKIIHSKTLKIVVPKIIDGFYCQENNKRKRLLLSQRK